MVGELDASRKSLARAFGEDERCSNGLWPRSLVVGCAGGMAELLQLLEQDLLVLRSQWVVNTLQMFDSGGLGLSRIFPFGSRGRSRLLRAMTVHLRQEVHGEAEAREKQRKHCNARQGCHQLHYRNPYRERFIELKREYNTQ